MANGIQTEIRPEVLAVAGLLAVGGIALIILGMGEGQGAEGFTSLTSPSLVTPQTVPIVFGNALLSGSALATVPTYMYRGPARNVFGYFRIEQKQGTITATVYGSGLTGAALPDTPTPTLYRFVPPDVNGQGYLQPTGCPNAGQRTFDLCAKSYPGGVLAMGVTDICGFYPVPGPADAVLELYGDTRPGEGYEPPTCTGRIPLARQKFPGAILFQ